jgi:hypothetical protein
MNTLNSFRSRTMMSLIAPVALMGALPELSSRGDPAPSETQTIVLDFSTVKDGKGQPTLRPASDGTGGANLDGGTPLKDGSNIILHLAPGDHVTMALDSNGPRDFTGRNMQYTGELVRIHRHGGFFGMFETETREPHLRPSDLPPTLHVGQELRLDLVIRYANDPDHPLKLPLQNSDDKVEVHLAAAADLSIELTSDPDAVVWEDRSPTAGELDGARHAVDQWKHDGGYNEGRLLDEGNIKVTPGNLGQLRARLVAERQ